MRRMNDRTYGMLLVALATVLWSTSGLFVRMLDLDGWTILGWRSFFGAVTLGLIVLWQRGWRLGRSGNAFGAPGWAGVVLAAVSVVGYIGALKFTTVANVLAIYATVPFVAAGFAFAWLGERPERRVILASGVALFGVLVVVGFAASADDLVGSALAFVMTACFAALVVMAKRFPALGMAKVNALGSLACVLVSLPFMSAVVPSAGELVVLAAFGFISTGLAYLLFLAGGRYIPSGEAGLIALLDVVMAPLWVWLAFSENPGLPTIVGSGVILAAVFWYLWAGRKRPGIVVSV